jgi:PPE-repeat protein
VDYLALPPEINSARIYAGPGAAPLMAASAAWSSLAAELGQAAASYSGTVMGLDAAWMGPSSIAMTAGALSYVQWLTMSAGHAAETAMQAQVAAAAYEAAWAGSVPPPVIAANRTLLMTLVATNFLGINTPAIMATEAHYMEMWAQDVAAMVAYQAASMAATSALPPFVPSTPNTNPGGIGAQATSVSIAAATPAGNAASTANSAVSSLGDLFGNPFIQTLNGYGQNFLSSGAWNPVTYLALFTSGHDFAPGQFPDALAATPRNIAAAGADTGGGGVPVPEGGVPATNPMAPSSAVSAGMGNASTAGNLSVPPGWNQQANQSRLASLATPAGGASEGVAPRMGPVASGIPTAIGAVSSPKGSRRQGEEILTKARFIANKGL